MANAIDAPNYEEHTVSSHNVTISLIVWQRWKAQMPGMIEAIMELNQDLEEAGTELPLGAVVLIPIPVERDQTVLDPIELF